MSDETVNRTVPVGQPLRLPFGHLGSQQGPNGPIIHGIHRGPDGYIPVATKRDGAWAELGAVPVNQPLIPQLLDHLTTDGYFALNTSFGTGKRTTGTRKVWKPLPKVHPEYGPIGLDFPGAVEQVEVPTVSRTHPVTGLPFQRHDSNALRWLNVCHVDIDCYNVGLSVGDTVGAIINMQNAGQLPPATMFARSGRGLWAFWLLLDPDNPTSGTKTVHNAHHTPTTPQRAHPRAVAFYAKVQAALADRLRHLGADLGALDGCRFAPVPGTLKTATDTRVEYWVQGTHGHGFAYTLRNLATALDLEIRDREHPAIEAALTTDPAKHAGLSAAGKKGWKAKYRYLLADVQILLNLRGGGFHANRHRSLFLYATILRCNGMDQFEEVEPRIIDTARKSRPDAQGGIVTDAEARAAVRSAFKKMHYPLNAGRLYEAFRVTDRESTYLQHIRATPPAPAKRRTAADRHAAIRAIVQQLGRVPSTREMAEFTTAQGFEANFTSIWRDYKALGLNPQKKAGRPKRSTLF